MAVTSLPGAPAPRAPRRPAPPAPTPPSGVAAGRPNSLRSASSAALRSAESVFTYDAKATTCTTPPFFFSAASCSSSRLRLTSASARIAECDAMIGALVSCKVCIIDSFEGCDTSIMMPTWFISAIACLPSGDRPCHFQPFDFAGVRVGQLAVAVVRERQIARAAAVELLDAAEILAEGIAVLDTDERDFAARRIDLSRLGRGQRQADLARARFCSVSRWMASNFSMADR